MTQFYTAVLLCVAQVTLVVAVTWLLCRWAGRRNPGGGAAVAGGAVAAVLMLTAIAFVPLPDWARWPVELGMLRSAEPADAHDVEAAAKPVPAEAGTASGGAGGLEIEFGDVRWRGDGEARSVGWWSVVFRASFWLHVAAAIVALTMAVFVGRQVWGLRAIGLLRRRSRPIVDPRLEGILGDLPDVLHSGPVELRETDELGSAAAVGHVRPAVLLPGDWRTWTDGELRAVLAHELAHVARRDCAGRFVACLCGAIHFYHPLVRWLVRRLVLEQEYAADRLAADAVGGWQTYVRLLSRFALRQVQGPTAGVCPAFLPVSSSFLTRRIEMLRTMDGLTDARRARRVRRAAVLVVVAVALAAAGLRGSTGHAQEQAAAETKVVAETTKQVADKSDPKASAQIEAFDPTVLPLFEKGILLVRVKAVLDRPEAQSLKPALENAFGALCKSQLDVDEPPIGPYDIEWIAMVPRMRVRLDPATGEERSSLMFGNVVVRFRQADDWKSRVKALSPEVKERQGSDGTYLEVPTQGMRISSVDDRTLLLQQMVIDTKSRLAGLLVRNEPHGWASHWKAIAQDDVAFVCDLSDIDWPAIDEAKLSPQNRDARRLAKQSHFYVVGVDCADGTDQLRLRSRVTAKSGGKTTEMEVEVDKAINVTKNELLANTSGKGKQILSALFDSVVINAGGDKGGEKYVEVEMKAEFDLAELITERIGGEKAKRR